MRSGSPGPPTQTTLYTYYANSNRLLTNGKYAFVYDANGNLIKKGNTYTIGAGQQVTFTTSGEGVEYWEYGYDPRNQLVQVTRNGQVVGSYSYDGEGLRVAGASAYTVKFNKFTSFLGRLPSSSDFF